MLRRGLGGPPTAAPTPEPPAKQRPRAQTPGPKRHRLVVADDDPLIAGNSRPARPPRRQIRERNDLDELDGGDL